MATRRMLHPTRRAAALLLWSLLTLPSTGAAWQAGASPLAFDPGACHAIPDTEFTKRNRLAAMLTMHANAYFGTVMAPLTAGVPATAMTLDDAVLFLRCDKDGLALSRRRRAIAKLAAYGWPTGEFARELLVLGLDLDGFKPAVTHELQPYLVTAVLKNRTILEFWFARLLHRHPRLIADSDNDPCDDQPEKPYDPPFSDDQPSYISIESYVTVKMPASDVHRNIDPQRWDECSKFWPTPDPSMQKPLYPGLGSTYIATQTSTDCTLDASEIVPDPKPPTVGTTYANAYFFEYFDCSVSPCDSEFENLLSITVEEDTHDVLNVGKFWTHRVDYGLPVCKTNGGFDDVDGDISSRVDGQKPPPRVIIDEGTMDVWRAPDSNGVVRTHVRGHKKVKFSNPITNGSAGVALGFTELNEELAEVACCLK